MREAWLYDVLGDGTLVDNHSYTVADGFLYDFDRQRCELNERYTNRGACTKDREIWNFLHRTSMLSDLKRAGKLSIFSPFAYEHNTNDKLIHLSGNNLQNFRLETGNVVGFIRDHDYSLKIGSRFGDRFLKHIIADADGFLELKDKGGESDENDYSWLLAFLWNVKFLHAQRLGLPKEYVAKLERIPKPRGNIDVIDFFQNHRLGKYKCSYREHSYQTQAASLFVAAYESMERTPTYASIIQPSRKQYRAFAEVNAGLRRRRSELLATNHFTNPFYSDYNKVIDLSKQILRNQNASFGKENPTSAFLFDISMLFEYFLRKIIKRSGFSVFSKFNREYQIPTGALGEYRRDLQPDLVFEHENERFVFDVKYKSFDAKFGSKREDIFQIHTYLGQLSNTDTPVRACGLIYPIHESRWVDQGFEDNGYNDSMKVQQIYQQGRRIDFLTIFIRIPDDNENFNFAMRDSSTRFISSLKRYVWGNRHLTSQYIA